MDATQDSMNSPGLASLCNWQCLDCVSSLATTHEPLSLALSLELKLRNCHNREGYQRSLLLLLVTETKSSLVTASNDQCFRVCWH